jgi:co-chaperonin GroES (HSP10)
MKNNYVLVKEIDEETVTEGGIIIPSNSTRNRKALVIEAGNCDQVQNGDTVLKNLGKGTMMTINNETFEMIHINHIMCVVKKA